MRQSTCWSGVFLYVEGALSQSFFLHLSNRGNSSVKSSPQTFSRHLSKASRLFYLFWRVYREDKADSDLKGDNAPRNRRLTASDGQLLPFLIICTSAFLRTPLAGLGESDYSHCGLYVRIPLADWHKTLEEIPSRGSSNPIIRSV